MAFVGLLCSTTTVQAQDKPYTDGTVWDIGFIKLKANMGDEYLKGLANTWVKVHQEAQAQGLIVSFKVLSGGASNPDDFDIMLMTERKNMAAYDNSDAAWDAVYKKVIGGEEAVKVINEGRVEMREVYGGKRMRELKYK